MKDLPHPLRSGGRRGCITSTPKTADFGEKWRFWPKYERSSCMPLAKNGERPYPEAPKSQFSDPRLGLVLRLSAGHTSVSGIRLTHADECLFYKHTLPGVDCMQH